MPFVAALALATLVTIPIPGDPIPPGTPEYVGSPATPQPVTAPAPPQHPFLAPDPGNNIHNDAYMTDAYPGPGPLGVDPKVTSTLQVAECASLTFDRRGRLETVCVGAIRPTLKLFDPTSLKQIASYNLPPRPLGLNLFTDFSGGGYFYLDDQDRAVIPTTSNRPRRSARKPRAAHCSGSTRERSRRAKYP